MRKAVRAIVFNDNKILVIRRNKFGRKYCTLPGGGMDIGETAEQALYREMQEETGLKLGQARAVFTEEAGEPYGTQYIYLVDFAGGEPVLSPDSIEASINKLGQNTYEPAWITIDELSTSGFVSERLKQDILDGIKNGFPDKPRQLS